MTSVVRRRRLPTTFQRHLAVNPCNHLHLLHSHFSLSHFLCKQLAKSSKMYCPSPSIGLAYQPFIENFTSCFLGRNAARVQAICFLLTVMAKMFGAPDVTTRGV